MSAAAADLPPVNTSSPPLIYDPPPPPGAHHMPHLPAVWQRPPCRTLQKPASHVVSVSERQHWPLELHGSLTGTQTASGATGLQTPASEHVVLVGQNKTPPHPSGCVPQANVHLVAGVQGVTGL